MRILLVKAAYTRDYGQTVPPMGLLYLSAALKRAGYRDVDLLHLGLERPTPAELSARLRRDRPDLICISAITAEARSMHQTARLVKLSLPEARVVVGGPHPTAYVADCLANPAIDLVVRNEGEETLPLLVDALTEGRGPEGLEGISYRKDGEIVDAPSRELVADLDRLPPPDWDAIDPDAYRRFIPHSPFLHARRYMNVVTSRGCPYSCTFCHNVMGRRFRAHSAERVLEEIELLHSRYGISNIEISDDIFNLDRDRAATIMEGIIDRGLDLELYLSNGVRTDLLDDELISLFARAGVSYMCIAVETGSRRMQRRIKKNADLDRIRSACAKAVEEGIFVNGFFMLGFPDETLGEMLETVRYLWSLPIHSCMISYCLAYEGTEIAASVLPHQRISPLNDTVSYSSSRPLVSCSAVPPWQLTAIRQLANVGFYFFNPARLYRILRDLPSRSPAVQALLLKKLLTRTLVLR